MKSTLLFLAFGAALGFKTDVPMAAYEPVAVVELFTSEGCSSCPPADRLLAQTVRQATAERRVIGLSFHVDYWDHLGWKDPFSQRQFTERQKRYARQLRLNSLYTPQVVVNGRQELVGSNAGKLSAALTTALRQPATVRITPQSPTWPDRQTLRLSYRLEGDWAETALNVALITKTATRNVQRGENEGHDLTHSNVVRTFQTLAKPTSAAGSVTLVVPTDFDRSNGAVVFYAQAVDGSVRGAGVVGL